MSYKECDKGLLASFAAPATGVTQGMRGFAQGRKGFATKSLLPNSTAGDAGECLFNGLTRRSTQDYSSMNYCLPYQFIHSRYDSTYIDVGYKYSTN